MIPFTTDRGDIAELFSIVSDDDEAAHEKTKTPTTFFV
jgi:hypothetical protein